MWTAGLNGRAISHHLPATRPKWTEPGLRNPVCGASYWAAAIHHRLQGRTVLDWRAINGSPPDKRMAMHVKRLYRTASVLTAERVVFNVKGNDYRLVAAIDFEKGIVWIKWIGTHKDYGRINVSEVEHDG